MKHLEINIILNLEQLQSNMSTWRQKFQALCLLIDACWPNDIDSVVKYAFSLRAAIGWFNLGQYRKQIAGIMDPWTSRYWLPIILCYYFWIAGPWREDIHFHHPFSSAVIRSGLFTCCQARGIGDIFQKQQAEDDVYK